jgi:hypothetical protein
MPTSVKCSRAAKISTSAKERGIHAASASDEKQALSLDDRNRIPTVEAA